MCSIMNVSRINKLENRQGVEGDDEVCQRSGEVLVVFNKSDVTRRCDIYIIYSHTKPFRSKASLYTYTWLVTKNGYYESLSNQYH